MLTSVTSLVAWLMLLAGCGASLDCCMLEMLLMYNNYMLEQKFILNVAGTICSRKQKFIVIALLICSMLFLIYIKWEC